MRVYARYFSESGLNFRLNTVLQFGDSWNIIGAAVLINPGSAKPIGNISPEEQQHLEAITSQGSDWHCFTADPTMNQLGKIFNGWYAGKETPLNGVILLFNLFNLRDKNLNQALELQKSCASPLLFSTDADIEALKVTDCIYLGWGNTGKYALREYAQKIFEAVKSRLGYYVDEDFNHNAFYHPGYVNRSYRRNKTTKQIVYNFNKELAPMTSETHLD